MALPLVRTPYGGEDTKLIVFLLFVILVLLGFMTDILVMLGTRE